MYKPFFYSRKKLLSMTYFEKKLQNKISRVKGLKGWHTSGWVKVTVSTQDKLYLDEPITKVKQCGLATACKLHEFNVRLIMDLCGYGNKDDLQVLLKSHVRHSRQCLIMSRQLNHQTNQTKLITKTLQTPMNPDMVLIGTLK